MEMTIEYSTPAREWRMANIEIDWQEDYSGRDCIEIIVSRVQGCDEDGNTIDVAITDEEEAYAQEAGLVEYEKWVKESEEDYIDDDHLYDKYQYDDL